MNYNRESLKQSVRNIKDWLSQIFEDLHKHPELGWQEKYTSTRICELLDEMDISFEKGKPGTAIVGLLEGKTPGKTVALRADIDALPIQEKTGLSYASLNEGVMHACGHDAHTAILLGAAKVLSSMRDEIKGNIKFLFQPDEENQGGALPMIAEGCLENPKVDYVLGLHVDETLPAGKIRYKYGKMAAASDYINITIKGKASHGASPEEGIDALLVAANILTSLQTIVAREISPTNSVALSFGKISAGNRVNILAENVEFNGTLRTLDEQARDFCKKRIVEVVEGVAKSMRAEGLVEIIPSYAPLINDDFVTGQVREVAEHLLGDENVSEMDAPSLGVEDFSFYLQKVPGAFYNLGCVKPEKPESHILHNPYFEVDQKCLETGVLLQVANALNLLNK